MALGAGHVVSLAYGRGQQVRQRLVFEAGINFVCGVLGAAGINQLHNGSNWGNAVSSGILLRTIH